MSVSRQLLRALQARALRLAASMWLGPEVPGPDAAEHPEPTPAPQAPQPPAWTLSALAQPLGLSLRREDEALIITRGELAVAVAIAPIDALALDEAPDRAAAFGMLMGVRLGLDTIQAAWSPAIERPEAPAEVWRKEDIPPEHGARTLRLLPTLAATWCAALAPERALVVRPWLDPALGLSEIPTLEIGRGLHVLSAEALAALPFDEATVFDDARRALFYDSYRLAPREVSRDARGRLRASRSTEGLAASRGALMPELDWDAARASGTFALPERDALLVVEPAGDHDAALELLAEAAQQAQQTARYPMRATLLALSGDDAPTITRLDSLAADFDAREDALHPARCLIGALLGGASAREDDDASVNAVNTVNDEQSTLDEEE